MKKLATTLLAALLVLSLAACNQDASETETTAATTPTAEIETTSASETEVQVTETEEPTNPPTTEPTYPLGSLENPYQPGMYKVGVDLPAGEYIFVAENGMGYVCASTDSNQDDIIENENFFNAFFMTVADGQYLQVKRCAFVDAADNIILTNEDGSFGEGMYRVGTDIPAGEYKLTADGNNLAYYCIYNSSEIPFDIVNNDNFEGSTYVTVSDGQYLIIKRCTANPS